MIEVKRAIPIEIRQLETNLKNYNSRDYKHYPLTKEEADVVLRLIENYGNEREQFEIEIAKNTPEL